MTHCSPADTGTEPKVWISKISRLSSSVTGGGGRVERAMQCWQLEPPNELIVIISIVLLGVFGYSKPEQGSPLCSPIYLSRQFEWSQPRWQEGGLYCGEMAEQWRASWWGVCCLNYRLGMWASPTLGQGVKWKIETKMWTTKVSLHEGGENILTLKI